MTKFEPLKKAVIKETEKDISTLIYIMQYQIDAIKKELKEKEDALERLITKCEIVVCNNNILFNYETCGENSKQ